ncbi:unnamed protein product [Prorocentrum cordatum]|uniref:Uncharacterized protein n=1 Tax=Prorocentrum cordatum TaxID=2364126 RepID=A0ABN9RWY5_9DINO|nr:unnamed protein product [Polarella glacialis]
MLPAVFMVTLSAAVTGFALESDASSGGSPAEEEQNHSAFQAFVADLLNQSRRKALREQDFRRSRRPSWICAGGAARGAQRRPEESVRRSQSVCFCRFLLPEPEDDPPRQPGLAAAHRAEAQVLQRPLGEVPGRAAEAAEWRRRGEGGQLRDAAPRHQCHGLGAWLFSM